MILYYLMKQLDGISVINISHVSPVHYHPVWLGCKIYHKRQLNKYNKQKKLATSNTIIIHVVKTTTCKYVCQRYNSM